LISTSTSGFFGLSVWMLSLPENGPLPISGFRVTWIRYSRPSVFGSSWASIPLRLESTEVTLIGSVEKARTVKVRRNGSLSSRLAKSAVGGVTAITGRTKPEIGISTIFCLGWVVVSRT